MKEDLMETPTTNGNAPTATPPKPAVAEKMEKKLLQNMLSVVFVAISKKQTKQINLVLHVDSQVQFGWNINRVK